MLIKLKQFLSKYWVTIIAVIIVIFVLWSSSVKRTAPIVAKQPTYQTLLYKIDSLNNEVNILRLQRDSIMGNISTSQGKLITINHEYEKKLIDITNQPIAADCRFFSEYLSENSK